MKRNTAIQQNLAFYFIFYFLPKLHLIQIYNLGPLLCLKHLLRQKTIVCMCNTSNYKPQEYLLHWLKLKSEIRHYIFVFHGGHNVRLVLVISSWSGDWQHYTTLHCLTLLNHGSRAVFKRRAKKWSIAAAGHTSRSTSAWCDVDSQDSQVRTKTSL